jgi:hypothetical protein
LVVSEYRIEDGPTFVRDARDAPIPGHHEATFTAGDGTRVRRYLTDKGRAEVLRGIDEGRRTLTEADFEALTVEPSLKALLARMDREAGEGA